MTSLPALTLEACRPWIGFAVADCWNEPVGTLRSVWAREDTGQIQFFGVQSAGTAGRDLLVPAEGVEVDADHCWMGLPYARALVQEAPAYAACAELTPERKGEIYLHYDVQATLRPQSRCGDRSEIGLILPV